ncbi:MAG: phosphatase PAP2 family protein [Marinoscillum sp.]
MLEWLQEIDRNLFLTLNGFGSPHLDGLMIFMSNKYVWIPLYLLLVFRLYQEHGKKFYQPIIALLLVVLCTDQMTSTVMKPYFERLRPCNDPGLSELMNIINGCGGKFGFASGHAANSFGVAAFFFLKEKSKSMVALLIWAALVSYSRIYLGVHYPGDVFVGALIGFGFGYLWLKLYQRLKAKAYLP